MLAGHTVPDQSRFSFEVESLESWGVLGQFFGKEFQSDGAIEPGVLGPIEHTHPTTAKLLHEAVVGDRSAHSTTQHFPSRTWFLENHKRTVHMQRKQTSLLVLLLLTRLKQRI